MNLLTGDRRQIDASGVGVEQIGVFGADVHLPATAVGGRADDRQAEVDRQRLLERLQAAAAAETQARLEPGHETDPPGERFEAAAEPRAPWQEPLPLFPAEVRELEQPVELPRYPAELVEVEEHRPVSVRAQPSALSSVSTSGLFGTSFRASSNCLRARSFNPCFL